MARPPRVQLARGLYHVSARGNRKQEIFAEEQDNARFLGALSDVVERFEWRCHAYCLMPNHYHALIETAKPNLSAGIQHLNGCYAQWFNRRHGFDGHLFQGRFHSVLVESTWHLLELSRYLVLNPVRGGLTRHPGEWPWSSYLATAGQAPAPRFLTTDFTLSQFGRTPARARRSFVAFVRDAADGRQG